MSRRDIWAYNPDICDGDEVWKPVEGYEGLYEVSNLGRVRKIEYRLLKSKSQNGGYQRIGLSKDGKQKQFLVHRLVAEAFIPNPGKLPIINHRDERPWNNRMENLEWCTHKHNANWGTAPQRVSEHSARKSAVISIDPKTGEEVVYPSVSSAGKAITGKSIGGSSISEAASGKRKTAYGKIWKYARGEAACTSA